MRSPSCAAIISLVAILIVLLVGCSASGRAGTSAVGESAAASLELGSFNIRYANDADGPNAWKHRAPMVIAMLREADVWGLQEALPEQIAAIAEALPEYSVIARTRERDASKGEACPILYRRDRWDADPLEQGTFWLSETPEEPGSKSWDSSLPRIATFARLIERSSGRAFYLVNVHLDHRGATARLEAARLVAARIAERRHPDPVVVLGDFNTGPDSPPVRALLAEGRLGLRDAWRVGNPDAPERGSFNGWKERCEGERIDYLLVSDGLAVDSCLIDDRKPEGRWPSDHAAVRGRLRFR